MKKLFLMHWPALVFALVIGALTAFSPLVAIERMGEAYQGLPPLVSEDEIYYLARAQEVLDGYPTLGNPYLYEHKGDPGVQFWMPDAFIAHTSIGLFGSFEHGMRFYDFVLPVTAALLTYAVLYALTGRRLFSLSVSFLLHALFFLNFTRTPNPQLFLVVSAAYLSLLAAFQTGAFRWYVVAALLGGTMFYIYPFWWTLWAVLLVAAVIACFLFAREEKAYLSLIGVFICTLVLGIPYFLDSVRAASLPHYAESLTRIGFIETHMPSGIVPVSIAGAALLAFLWCWRQRLIPRTSSFALAAAGAFAGAAVMNQHIVTGANFQFLIHYQMASVMMSVFLIALIAAHLLGKRFSSLAVAACVIVAVFVLMQKVDIVTTPKESDVAAQRYAPVLVWLNANTELNDVVYADPTLSPYVPAYTHDNVFFSTYVFATYIADEEVRARYVRAYYFDELPRERVEETIYDAVGASYIGYYQHERQVDKVRKLVGIEPHAPATVYPPELIESLLVQAGEQKKQSFTDAMEGYRVDYLVWDMVRHPAWKLPSGLVKRYEANGLVVYAVGTP